jgi:diguanylate cyclase (GGDEF)-like protein
MNKDERFILLGEYNALKNSKRKDIESVVRKESGISDSQKLPEYLEKIINRATAHAIVGEFRERRHADTDALTGLKNRRGYAKAIIEKLAIRDTSYGIMHADMRKLKTINDTFGHQGGDKAIKRIATTLKETSRSSDTIIRYGGDEFAGIISTKEHHPTAIPHSSHDALAIAGLRMCASVHEKKLFIENEQVPLHADIGLSEFSRPSIVYRKKNR